MSQTNSSLQTMLRPREICRSLCCNKSNFHLRNALVARLFVGQTKSVLTVRVITVRPLWFSTVFRRLIRLPSSRPLTQTTRRCGTIDERIFISVTKCHKKPTISPRSPPRSHTRAAAPPPFTQARGCCPPQRRRQPSPTRHSTQLSNNTRNGIPLSVQMILPTRLSRLTCLDV